MSTRTAGPTTKHAQQRIGLLDTLRGFALFGIVITNAVHVMALWTIPDGSSTDGVGHTLDRLTEATVEALFAGRFYLLFALLFGYSFTLQISAAERVGASVNTRLWRRCLALLLVGVLHLALLWVGDVLAPYALACMVLIVLRGLRPWSAAALGVILYFGWSCWTLLPSAAGPLALLSGVIEQPRIHDGYAGGFIDTFTTQVSLAPGFFLLVLFTNGVPSLGMFLLGMAAGKRGILADAESVSRWAGYALWTGLSVGLPISAVTFADTMGWWQAPMYWAGIQDLVNPLMTVAYLAAIVLLARCPAGRSASEWLGGAGRIAATNYITQSLVFMVIYTGYGFALADEIPIRWVVVLALCTFAGQVFVSRWWLRGHPYGPVEWILRMVTYWAVPPWRSSRLDSRT
ncbi:DUF418 domain-containing protein [Nocardia donostiensis]|uniref:DUF418 domain-containing protein n=1 Tax=Nocardia donostiensis TaxID=1538463 RepID=A0A1W0BEX0_9NOCA|nr:DUF418 domain-containing protein [Nocardia donostiensis]ONM47300.1 hypothetical protein B0T46_18700 [Nocardia donostiensis]OQS16602.1 hypothetical protein B0T36_02650 [Nocardia donostiensis]OQS21079.1 hypothetical protein B0T44_08630 [Nocardia donostiensis]